MIINEIEKLTYADAHAIAIEEIKIKDHDCVFCDLGGHFGFSVLVYKNAMHVYYANDYELHHTYIVEEKGRAGLREFYIDSLKRKLYTNEELMQEIKTYEEYDKKMYFLRNYWIMRYEYLSIFGIGEEARKAFEKGKEIFKYYNEISFCYVSDKLIIEKQKEMLNKLQIEYEALKNKSETFREMIKSELENHEACITCTYEDALKSLGLRYEELTSEQKTIVKDELKKQIYREDF